MANSTRWYETLVQMLSQHKKGVDIRHLYTLATMVVGRIQSETVHLTAWVSDVKSRAKDAQSVQRRFARWLNNPGINVHRLYAPLIAKALQSWGEHTIYLALDTTVLWGKSGVIRVALVYRGRAVPIVWKVLDHPSATVAFEVYNNLLESVPP